MAQFLTSFLLGLASFQAVTAAPKVYPEVIPGPGLPSLAELNLTSAQLHEMKPSEAMIARAKLLARDNVPECGPSDAAYTDVGDIIACYNYLQSLGTQTCAVPNAPTSVEMCRSGSAHVTGFSFQDATSSYCADVSLAVLWVVNSCTRPDQSCAGFQAANGNGNLVVGATVVTW